MKSTQTTIKVHKDINKMLKNIKNDNDLRNMDQVLLFLIRDDSYSRGKEDSNPKPKSSINSSSPSHIQETPDQTRSDPQQVARINLLEGPLHTPEVKE